jgi:hypothetical protein
MALFTSTVRGEGSKHSPLLLIPAALRMPAGWLRATVDDSAPCFVYARGFGPRAALPIWRFPDMKVGDKVTVEIEPAEPYRATKTRGVCFDWNTFVGSDDRTFATDEADGILRLWSRYSAPFEMIRHPPSEALYWLLGFYQAEGSKGTTGNDFSFANTNVALIRNAIEKLHELGVGANQLYAEILQGVNESRESAIAKYESLGLKVTAVRPRPGKGGSAYVVHAHNSKPFRGMVNAALAFIFANEFPNRELAKAFAFGWLDGDGTITLAAPDIELRLAGLPDEHNVIKRALAQIFGWDLTSESTRYKGNKQGSEIGLRAEKIIDLLDANAFPFSMSRVRLLLGFDERARKFAEGSRCGVLTRWGLTEKGGVPTARGERVIAAYRRYLPEIEKARQLWTAEPYHFGVKGAPLPQQFCLRI